MRTSWTKGYGVTFEYWEVDKTSFNDVRQMYAVEECEITRDAKDATLGSATMTMGEFLPEETYIRAYLVAEQPAGSGNRERVCLGTFLAITPTVKMDGKVVERPLDLYTPLKELDDDKPPIGYTITAGTNAMDALEYIHKRGNVKVVKGTSSVTVPKNITANDSDTWLSFGTAVLDSVKMERTIDPYGYVGFAPVRDAASIAPSYVFADDEISILLPEAELTCDFHNVPNVVEVVLSGANGRHRARATNSDPNSLVSTVSRGRTVLERITNPEGIGNYEQALAHAKTKLRELSSSEREVVYRHGYCPVKLGDGVRLAYGAHGLYCNMKVIRQVIRCSTDLEVEETSTYSEVLWNG